MSTPAPATPPVAPPADPSATPPVTPPPATEPPKPDNGAPAAPAATDFDPTKVPDDQFAKVFDDPRAFNHPRFKELAEQAKKGREAEAAAAKAAEDKMKEDGKFKELLEQKDKELADLRTSLETSAVNNSITAKLASAGVVDAEAALLLINREGITNNDGKVEGVDAAIEALKTAKPYLFGTPQSTPIGAPSNPAPGTQPGGTKTFFRSQLSDNKFFLDNKDDIMAAMHAGTIVDDVSQRKV